MRITTVATALLLTLPSAFVAADSVNGKGAGQCNGLGDGKGNWMDCTGTCTTGWVNINPNCLEKVVKKNGKVEGITATCDFEVDDKLYRRISPKGPTVVRRTTADNATPFIGFRMSTQSDKFELAELGTDGQVCYVHDMSGNSKIKPWQVASLRDGCPILVWEAPIAEMTKAATGNPGCGFQIFPHGKSGNFAMLDGNSAQATVFEELKSVVFLSES